MKLLTPTYLFIAVLFYLSGCNLLGAGSYGNAEEYEINSNEDKLISAIKRFKKDNPQYNVPISLGVIDGRDEKGRGDGGLWYHIIFYDPVENELIATWTRGETDTKTTFALVSINKGLILGHWKDINRDFSDAENDRHKKRFEEVILNKVKSYLF